MGRVPWLWHCHEKLWRVSKGSGLAQKTAGEGGVPGEEPSVSCGQCV